MSYVIVALRPYEGLVDGEQIDRVIGPFDTEDLAIEHASVLANRDIVNWKEENRLRTRIGSSIVYCIEFLVATGQS